MLRIAKHFVTYMSFLGNRPAREIEPPDATRSDYAMDISPKTTEGTSTAPCSMLLILSPVKPPEPTVGTTQWHRKKGAKTKA